MPPAADRRAAISRTTPLPSEMKDSEAGSADSTFVEVNHPRDSVQGYFTSYGVTGFGWTGKPDHDWPGKAGLLVPNGPGFGEDVFTLGRPHPMIDGRVRRDSRPSAGPRR